MADEILVARRTQFVTVAGRRMTVSRGATARAGSAVAKADPGLFEPLVPDFEVEQEAPKAELPPAEPKAAAEAKPAPAADPAQVRKPGPAK